MDGHTADPLDNHRNCRKHMPYDDLSAYYANEYDGHRFGGLDAVGVALLHAKVMPATWRWNDASRISRL